MVAHVGAPPGFSGYPAYGSSSARHERRSYPFGPALVQTRPPFVEDVGLHPARVRRQLRQHSCARGSLRRLGLELGEGDVGIKGIAILVDDLVSKLDSLEVSSATLALIRFARESSIPLFLIEK
jgi:hypothetical protein